jgi:DNA-binding NtrC family response regulator
MVFTKLTISPHSIMIVDDEMELASLFRKFLAKLGFDSICFTNPMLALEQYESNPDKYSVIITDLRMPGMSGIELAGKIRQRNAPVKIILITAFDLIDLEGSPAYKQAKFDSILQKPIRFSQVEKRIGNVLKVQSI